MQSTHGLLRFHELKNKPTIFNIIYIMRTNMNSGTIRPFMAVIIIVVIVLLYTVHITVEMSCGLLRVFCSFLCFPV